MKILLAWLIVAKILAIVRPMVVKILVRWWMISKKLAIGYIVIYFGQLQCPPIFTKKIKQINEHKGLKRGISLFYVSYLIPSSKWVALTTYVVVLSVTMVFCEFLASCHE
jgi:hypothetical protein